VVLSAAKEQADGNGVVTRDQIIAATPEMKDGTRNGALTDLVANGDLTRIRNGVYAVQSGPSAQGSMF
jgi:predicted transcriptional regulator of viral defense system